MYREVPGRGFPSSTTCLTRRPPNQNDPNGYYHAFGLDPDATDAEVRRAYRFLARRMHPDGSDPQPVLFHVVQHIFSILGDEKARYRYDSTPEDQAFISRLEIDRLERRGIRLPTTPPSPDRWSYRTEGDLPVPEGLYEALLDRARQLRIQRVWRVHVVPGDSLYVDADWLYWGASLPVTPENVDAAMCLVV